MWFIALNAQNMGTFTYGNRKVRGQDKGYKSQNRNKEVAIHFNSAGYSPDFTSEFQRSFDQQK